MSDDTCILYSLANRDLLEKIVVEHVHSLRDRIRFCLLVSKELHRMFLLQSEDEHVMPRRLFRGHSVCFKEKDVGVSGGAVEEYCRVTGGGDWRDTSPKSITIIADDFQIGCSESTEYAVEKGGDGSGVILHVVGDLKDPLYLFARCLLPQMASSFPELSIQVLILRKSLNFGVYHRLMRGSSSKDVFMSLQRLHITETSLVLTDVMNLHEFISLQELVIEDSHIAAIYNDHMDKTVAHMLPPALGRLELLRCHIRNVSINDWLFSLPKTCRRISLTTVFDVIHGTGDAIALPSYVDLSHCEILQLVDVHPKGNICMRINYNATRVLNLQGGSMEVEWIGNVALKPCMDVVQTTQANVLSTIPLAALYSVKELDIVVHSFDSLDAILRRYLLADEITRCNLKKCICRVPPQASSGANKKSTVHVPIALLNTLAEVASRWPEIKFTFV
jgi:hypothetical protein